MRIRFRRDYRSRVWMCRYPAGAVVDVDRAEVVNEALDGGYAEPVDLAPLVADDAVTVTTEPKPEPDPVPSEGA